MRQVNTNTDTSRSYYIDRDVVLRKILEDNEEVFQTMVLPRILIDPLLQLAHNSAGHNGFQQVYLSIRQLYYWNNMKKNILHHCKQCAVCEKFKVEHIKFEKLHFSIPNQLMEFICMNLIGEFYPPTSRGHRYSLTVMDMLTGFLFCTPLKSKKAEEVIQTYLNEVYFRFSGSRKILSDNGMEFKNRMFEEVVKKLGCEVRAYSPPYRPQSNGKIECFHKFLKACMGKHINTHLEWDEVIPMVTAACNFFPHTPSKERPFFLMFGRDPLTGLQKLLGETTRYLGEGGGKLDLTALQNTYQLAAQNIQMARGRSKEDESSVPLVFQLGDLIMIRDHTAKAFKPKYKDEYRIVKILGKTQALLRGSKGNEIKHHVTYLKKRNPAKEVVEKIPDFKKFGGMTKLWLNLGLVPNLKWEYKVTEVGAIHCVRNSTQHTRLKQVIKLLILHSCFRFITGMTEQKNMRNLIRFYRAVQCLCNWCANNTAGLNQQCK